jgi:polysaccharide deacetylase family protein (PEP-CTERM system associated)
VNRAPAVANAFTVDFEDWFQGLEIEPSGWRGYEGRLQIGTRRLLDLLEQAGAHATFFVLGSAAEQAPELVREIRDRGHELGTHGYGHGFAYRLGPEGFRQDLVRSLEVLDRVAGTKILGHRAAFFSITRQSEWALDILEELGLAYDSSIFPVRNYRYGIPDAPRWPHRIRPGLAEFPITTWRWAGANLPVGGGAYFRIFPYYLTWLGLRRTNAGGHPAVFYLHPWELDPGQPRIRLPRRIGVTHYWNLGGTSSRLRRLLADFRFTAMREILGLHAGVDDRGARPGAAG